MSAAFHTRTAATGSLSATRRPFAHIELINGYQSVTSACRAQATALIMVAFATTDRRD